MNPERILNINNYIDSHILVWANNNPETELAEQRLDIMSHSIYKLYYVAWKRPDDTCETTLVLNDPDLDVSQYILDFYPTEVNKDVLTNHYLRRRVTIDDTGITIGGIEPYTYTVKENNVNVVKTVDLSEYNNTLVPLYIYGIR